MKSLFPLILTAIVFVAVLPYKMNAQSADICLTGATALTNFSTGAYPTCGSKADFNLDGKLDFIVSNSSSNNISLLLGTGTGSMLPAVNFSLPASPSGLVSADFNQDGKPDVAVSYFTTNSVTVLYGNGVGSFTSSLNYTVGTDPRSIVTADYNSDSRPDIITANYGSNNISVLLSTTSGTFSTAATYTTRPLPSSLTARDLNNDGFVDLAVVTLSVGYICTYLNGGTGTFTTTAETAIGFYMSFVHSADFNSDGYNDLVFNAGGGTFLGVSLNNGSGSFTNTVVYTNLNTGFLVSCNSSDFNGDGITDLAVGTSANDVLILNGTNTGSFTPFRTYNTGYPFWIEKGLINGDALTDIAVVNSANNLQILLGGSAGTFNGTMNYYTGTQPTSIMASDVNNDGNKDFVVLNWGAQSFSILHGSGTGTFVPAGTYSTVFSQPRAIDVGDFNSDGLKDVVVLNGFSYSVFMRTTAGTYTLNFTAPLNNQGNDIVVADLNNDNKNDIVISNYSLTLLFGTGTGSFTGTQTLSVAGNPAAIYVKDINLDGFKDILSVNSNSNSISILFGNGSGTFTNTVSYSAGVFPTDASIRDLNNDGYLDLAVTNYSPGAVAVLLGSSSGTFATASVFSVTANQITTLDSDDLNGDGFADLIMTSTGSGRLLAYAGTGTGSFVFSRAYQDFANPYSVVVSDVSGDTKPDVFFCNTAYGKISVMLNTTLPVTVTGPGSVCAGAAVTLTASGSHQYLWSNNVPTASVQVTPTVTTIYTVTGISYNGCHYRALKTVTAIPRPVISVNNGTLCAGESFTLLPSGAITYTYSGANNPVVTPSVTSFYTVTGLGTNGCTGLGVSTIVVNALPLISANSGSICQGNSFNLNPAGANTYTISGSGTQTVNPLVTTNYTISGSAFGCYGNSVIATVSVVNLPLPTISVNNGSICSGSSFTISPSGASTYTYEGGSNIVNPTVSTSYTVTGTSTAGCLSQNAATINVSVHDNPTISVNSGTICEGQSFTISPSGASNYTVQGGSNTVAPLVNTSYTVAGISAFGCISQNIATCAVIVNSNPTIQVNNGAICAGQQFTILPTGANTYTFSGGSNTVAPSANAAYSVVGSDVNGCVSATVISNVTVFANPTIAVNSGTICTGQTFTILPTGVAAFTVQGGSATVTPTSTSSYTVTGISVNGCLSQNIATTNIVVNTNPTVTVNSGSICAGQIFTILPLGASTYTLQGGSNTVSPAGTISYTVTGTGANGCISQNVATSTVTVYPNPVVVVLGNTPVMCLGESLLLTASGASSYSWSTASLNDTVLINPNLTSTYSVTGTDANGCSNTAVVTQIVDACTSILTNQLQNAEEVLQMWPNPNKGIFNVSVNENVPISILSVLGATVFEGIVKQGTSTIDINSFANGVYIVRILTEGKHNNYRIVKAE